MDRFALCVSSIQFMNECFPVYFSYLPWGYKYIASKDLTIYYNATLAADSMYALLLQLQLSTIVLADNHTYHTICIILTFVASSATEPPQWWCTCTINK